MVDIKKAYILYKFYFAFYNAASGPKARDLASATKVAANISRHSQKIIYVFHHLPLAHCFSEISPSACVLRYFFSKFFLYFQPLLANNSYILT